MVLSGHKVGLAEGFASELTEGKAGNKAWRARRSNDCSERHRNKSKHEKLSSCCTDGLFVASAACLVRKL